MTDGSFQQSLPFGNLARKPSPDYCRILELVRYLTSSSWDEASMH